LEQAVVGILGWQSEADDKGFILSRQVEQKPGTKSLRLGIHARDVGSILVDWKIDWRLAKGTL